MCVCVYVCVCVCVCASAMFIVCDMVGSGCSVSRVHVTEEALDWWPWQHDEKQETWHSPCLFLHLPPLTNTPPLPHLTCHFSRQWETLCVCVCVWWGVHLFTAAWLLYLLHFNLLACSDHLIPTLRFYGHLNRHGVTATCRLLLIKAEEIIAWSSSFYICLLLYWHYQQSNSQNVFIVFYG